MKKAIANILVLFCFFSCLSLTSFASSPSSLLPSWLPKDAPTPDPNSEITVVDFYFDENNNITIVDSSQPSLYTCLIGNHGSACIYWINRSQVYWGVTSNTGGTMLFSGSVSTNTGYYTPLVSLEFDGSIGGNLPGVRSRKQYTNTATLEGYMLDANGVSRTLPNVSSSLYYVE